jgi:hypothetical protein
MAHELTIRGITPFDIAKVKKIHEKFFKEEFNFPDFLRNYYCAFIIEKEDTIIAAAGVRPIAEIDLITNKDCSQREKRDALMKVLQVSSYTAAREGHNSLHAFIQDEGWQQHLIERANFKPTKGRSLFLEI